MSEMTAPELTPQESTIASPSLPSLEPRVINILHEPAEPISQGEQEINPTPKPSTQEPA